MREIKFRAWHTAKQKMSPTFSLEEIYLRGGDGYAASLWRERSNLIIQQYTGLKDKNGKEVYEGDVICIVKDNVVDVIDGWERTEPQGEFYEVVYKNGAFWVGDELIWEWVKDGEVVGNIYESPELLEDAKPENQ